MGRAFAGRMAEGGIGEQRQPRLVAESACDAGGLDDSTDLYDKAVAVDLAPHKLTDTLAFMFETRYVVRPTRYAMESPALQPGYDACWDGFAGNFKG